MPIPIDGKKFSRKFLKEIYGGPMKLPEDPVEEPELLKRSSTLKTTPSEKPTGKPDLIRT